MRHEFSSLLSPFHFELPTHIRYGEGIHALLPETAVSSARNGSNADNPRPMGKEDYLELLNRLARSG